MSNAKNPVVVGVLLGIALVLGLVGWSRYRSINDTSDASAAAKQLIDTQGKDAPKAPDSDLMMMGGKKKAGG